MLFHKKENKLHFTVSDVKKGRVGIKSSVPKEGSFIRALYDMFISKKVVISPKSGNNLTRIEKKELELFKGTVQSLINRYDLDIRSMGNRVYICFGTEKEDFCFNNLNELRHIS